MNQRSFFQQALDYARSKISLQETRWLLEFVTHTPYAKLVTLGDAALDQQALTMVMNLADRISQGEPFDYVTQVSVFRDRLFAVSPAVLIPRPETALLVDTVTQIALDIENPAILELGTGSGIIAISLSLEIPNATVTAIDISVDALDIAQKNANYHQACINFYQSRWFDQVNGSFDIIVSNPPYIADNDPHLRDLTHEPTVALTAGPTGMEAITEIALSSRQYLNRNGWLWFEHGYDQHEASQTLLAKAGYHSIQNMVDAFGNPRITGGQL